MKIYWHEGKKNIIGPRVLELRQKENISQRVLAARLQTHGLECNDLTILRIEKGQRFVPDYEVVILAGYFKVTIEYLLGLTDDPSEGMQIPQASPAAEVQDSLSAKNGNNSTVWLPKSGTIKASGSKETLA